MIARVRIAPVERWCERAKSYSGHDLAGMEIEIITETCMQSDDCEGKAWMEPLDCSLKRDLEIGAPNPGKVPTYVCEHMLEMD